MNRGNCCMPEETPKEQSVSTEINDTNSNLEITDRQNRILHRILEVKV